MAFRLRHWLAAVAVTSAVVAAWLLPLDGAPTGRFERSAAELRHAELTRELNTARVTLDQLRRSGRLPDATLAAAEDGVGLLIPDAASLESGQEAALRLRIVREATALGPIEPGMVVAYGYDGSDGGATGLDVSQSFRLETYVGEQDGTAYCAHVVVTRPQSVSFFASEDLRGAGWSRWTQSLLGPCVFYATHGRPGAAIQTWLEAGGSDFAFGHPFDGAPELERAPNRWLFGARRGMVSPPTVERCTTGDAEACAATFLEPTGPWASGAPDREPGSPVAFSGRARGGPFPADDWFLLADLEAEFGTAAFRRFWTSDQDVATAFESAFGMDLGHWLITWLDDGPGLGRRSPAPSWPLTLAGLLTVALLTGTASAWQVRRQVS